MHTDPEAQANKYRREAEHLRHAVELIYDPDLREQLLSFARQYNAAAVAIEREVKLKPLTQPKSGGEVIG